MGREDVRQQQGLSSYGDAREGATPVDAYHFSQTKRSALSSAMYGRGLKGLEAKRLDGADLRLKQRIYFCIDAGKLCVHPRGEAHRALSWRS